MCGESFAAGGGKSKTALIAGKRATLKRTQNLRRTGMHGAHGNGANRNGARHGNKGENSNANSSTNSTRNGNANRSGSGNINDSGNSNQPFRR
jgi:hypothetical protein